MHFIPLDNDNIINVYELFKKNKIESLVPLEYFKKGTLEDEGFDSDLTLILESENKQEIISALVAVIRFINSREFCYLKACLVDKNSQRQGIGTLMLKELISRARSKGIAGISYGDSVPNYWQPGVDLRHTSLYFFLKKHKFRSLRMRQNLTVNLENLKLNPKSRLERYIFERINKIDFQKLYYFVKTNFPEETWAEEVALSYMYNPPSTFIAKDSQHNIIGWATHSQLFPGSFGPTGVVTDFRGKGIGSELLKWALWDMKQNHITKATIMWVVGDTIKYYSKVIDAYISPVFIPMTYKLS
ncbi:MAG: GNAT family N-acetyltransferase [Candidatus Thorarchaeota archaeon]